MSNNLCCVSFNSICTVMQEIWFQGMIIVRKLEKKWIDPECLSLLAFYLNILVYLILIHISPGSMFN